MNKFNEVALGEVKCTKTKYSFTGGPFGSDLKNSDYTEQGIRVIQLQNMGDGIFYDNHRIYTSIEKADQLKSCNIFPGDIIIAKMAEPLARATIIPNVEERYLMCSDGIRLVVDKENYDVDYICYAINFHKFRKEAERRGTGTTRLRIGLTTLKDIRLLLPDLKIQKKISKILKSIDKLIKLTEMKINKLNKIKLGLSQDLLIRGVDQDGKLRPSDEDDLSMYRESELGLGKIPTGWSEFVLKEKIKVKGGKRVPKGKEFAKNKTPYPYIRVSDFKDNSVDTSNLRFVSMDVFQSIKNYTISCEDIYISVAGTIGLVGRIPSTLDGACLTENADKLIILDKKKIDQNFMIFSLSSNYLQHQIFLEIGVGGGVPKLAVHRIESLKIKLPSIEEQRIIVQKIRTIDRNIKLEESKLKKFKCLKSGLMENLLSGKVEVKA